MDSGHLIMKKVVLLRFSYVDIIYYLFWQSRADKDLLRLMGNSKLAEEWKGVLKTKN